MCKMNCRHHLFSICYFYFRRGCCCCCPVIWLNVIFPSLLFLPYLLWQLFSDFFCSFVTLSTYKNIQCFFLLSPNQVFSLSKPHRLDIYGQKNCGMFLCAALKESLTNFSRYSIFLSQYNGNDCGGQHLLKQNIKAARLFFCSLYEQRTIRLTICEAIVSLIWPLILSEWIVHWKGSR